MNYDLYYMEIVSGQLSDYNQTCKISVPLTKCCYHLICLVLLHFIFG